MVFDGCRLDSILPLTITRATANLREATSRAGAGLHDLASSDQRTPLQSQLFQRQSPAILEIHFASDHVLRQVQQHRLAISDFGVSTEQ